VASHHDVRLHCQHFLVKCLFVSFFTVFLLFLRLGLGLRLLIVVWDRAEANILLFVFSVKTFNCDNFKKAKFGHFSADLLYLLNARRKVAESSLGF